MRTILVLADHPELPEALQTGLSAGDYRVLHYRSVQEAEPLLVHGLAQVCVLDLELTSVQSTWQIEQVRRSAPQATLIICSSTRLPEWEEQAYLLGASYVLAKPVRIRSFEALLHRQTAPAPIPVLASSHSQFPAGAQATDRARLAPEQIPAGLDPRRTLALARDFFGILTHSLDAEAMLHEFLLLLRDILGINRAAIFIRPREPGFAGAGETESRRFKPVCSIGMSSGLLQHLELSRDSGIGGQVTRLARILRRNSEEAQSNPETQKEFELLGGQVAIPIPDRESLLGVAVFDGRITGEPLANGELELIFHLLEQLGLALKNIWLHDQLSANHAILAQVLRELSNACVVVGRDLAILHANKTARKYFGGHGRGGELEFADLPQAIGSKVYQVLKTGSAVSNFRYEPDTEHAVAYNVSIVPFQDKAGGLPASALLIVEDLTQSEQLRRLELEAADLRLLRRMADRLTAEIGNALVPVSTHHQLLRERWRDSEFRSSLETALGEGVKRINRLINQMRFLARDSVLEAESFPVVSLLDEAYAEACKYSEAKASQLRYENPAKALLITGDRAALKLAFSEIMLNALQANPEEPKIGVRLNPGTNGNNKPQVQIEVRDNGPGFSSEAARNATAPFFGTRTVGVGLGLTVCRKIFETHRGMLEIVPAATGHEGLVRISLPLESGISA